MHYILKISSYIILLTSSILLLTACGGGKKKDGTQVKYEMQILKETQVVWEESLESMHTLYEAGVYQSPAVYQMEASLASVRAGIVETQEDIETTESALCLLLSEMPHKKTCSPRNSVKWRIITTVCRPS